MADDISVRFGTVVGPGPDDIVWDEPSDHAEAQAVLDEAFAYYVSRSPDLSRLWDGVAVWVMLERVERYGGFLSVPPKS